MQIVLGSNPGSYVFDRLAFRSRLHLSNILTDLKPRELGRRDMLKNWHAPLALALDV
jgi:hypothetical protein